jgi:hypothetical protein
MGLRSRSVALLPPPPLERFRRADGVQVKIATNLQRFSTDGMGGVTHFGRDRAIKTPRELAGGGGFDISHPPSSSLRCAFPDEPSKLREMKAGGGVNLKHGANSRANNSQIGGVYRHCCLCSYYDLALHEHLPMKRIDVTKAFSSDEKCLA